MSTENSRGLVIFCDHIADGNKKASSAEKALSGYAARQGAQLSRIVNALRWDNQPRAFEELAVWLDEYISFSAQSEQEAEALSKMVRGALAAAAQGLGPKGPQKYPASKKIMQFIGGLRPALWRLFYRCEFRIKRFIKLHIED